MSNNALRILLVGSPELQPSITAPALEGTAYAAFAVDMCSGLAQATDPLADQRYDAVIFLVSGQEAERLLVSPTLSQAMLDSAVIVVSPHCSAELVLRFVQRGVQDVLDGPLSQGQGQLARCLRLAIERERMERDTRTAYATDLHTGLPNRQQLVEHMSQLLALRGREPAPMAVLVLRLEGLDTTEATLGSESAKVLLRKVAVRLRSTVRASDVVAAIGSNAFALLLASTEEPLDADRVATKLQTVLHDPYTVAGQQVGVCASIGVSHFPADGSNVGVLLRKAAGAAAATQASGRDGYSNWLESLWGDTGAANDDAAPER